MVTVGDNQVDLRLHLSYHFCDHVGISNHPEALLNVILEQLAQDERAEALERTVHDVVDAILLVGIKHKDAAKIGFGGADQVEPVHFGA